jgi:pimeloyl-ACP methyl ester carboxylesterase
MARLILGPAGVPILGATLMRLRNRFVSDAIMTGGVSYADAMSPELRADLYEVGERTGHYQAFLSLLAHEQLWSEARSLYPQIRVPTLLIYGDQDWAPVAPARDRHRAACVSRSEVRLMTAHNVDQRWPGQASMREAS